MAIVILSTSLNPDSRSRIMAQAAADALAKRGAEAVSADLRDFPLPLCDGDAAYADANVGKLAKLIREAAAILVAVPIYNYDVGAALKNALELTGRAWNDKIVGFLCAAGGMSSYMSVMSFANSLMLDFRCLIIPRFVYAEGDDFDESGSPSGEIRKRIDDLAAEALRLAGALR